MRKRLPTLHPVRVLLTMTVLALATTACAAAATLDEVKARGKLRCGVNEGLVGFAAKNAAGTLAGFDVDFCRAVAASIFDDADKVEFVTVGVQDRFTALRDRKIDVLSRNSTWTIGRETEFGLTFVGAIYYDGQGFMVRRSANVNSVLELGGKKICVQERTTTFDNLADYFSVNNLAYEAVTTVSSADSVAKYKEGLCDVITSDMSQLYAARLGLSDAAEHVILPDAISKEPLSPAVRQDDPAWATLVRWVLFALLDAEELGVGSATIDAALASKKPDVRRLVGVDGNFGERMGLTKGWAVNFLRTVGNYGEIYNRHLGADSELGIPRGMNQLWSLGGIQYAPPIR